MDVVRIMFNILSGSLKSFIGFAGRVESSSPAGLRSPRHQAPKHLPLRREQLGLGQNR